MKVKELIEKLKQFDLESQVEFVGMCEYGWGESMEFVSRECHIQEERSLVQLIIQGEEQN